jgi:hypothetical protein
MASLPSVTIHSTTTTSSTTNPYSGILLCQTSTLSIVISTSKNDDWNVVAKVIPNQVITSTTSSSTSHDDGQLIREWLIGNNNNITNIDQQHDGVERNNNKMPSSKRKRQKQYTYTIQNINIPSSSIRNSNDNVTINPLLSQHIQHSFWPRRYQLFSLFDKGIQIPNDDESWYSITPEFIAKHIASRCLNANCQYVLDACSGCGGNAIQFALAGMKVIAIEIDSNRLQAAKKNAEIYGVQDKITFILGDAIQVMEQQISSSNTTPIDVIFLSPPWGGSNYKDLGNGRMFDVSTDIILSGGADGLTLFNTARMITKNIIYYLPKNVDRGAMLHELQSDFDMEMFIENDKKKIVGVGYFGSIFKSGSRSATTTTFTTTSTT